MSSNLTDSFVQDDQVQDNHSLLNSLQSREDSASSLQLSTMGSSVILASRTASSEYAFTISEPPSPHLQLTPAFQQAIITHTFDYHPTFVVIADKQEGGSEEDKEEDMEETFVSEELITKWNSEIGNTKNPGKAQKLIEKMRKLGALDGFSSKTDIPSARIGLCLLAGLDNQDNKMYALNSLLEILKNDTYEKSNSNRLVSLATSLLSLMAREVIQAVDLEAQNKIAEVYNVLAETLHHHFGKRHINGITQELKDLLVQAPKSLEKLNRLEDVGLKFNVNCAFEGVRRLKDDREELFELVEESLQSDSRRHYALYMKEPSDGFAHLEKAFKGIDPHLPNSWYNGVLILKSLARDVKTDPEQLTPLLMLIGKKFKKLNWKFTYAAIEILFQIVLNGETEEVRLRAFNGIKQYGYDFPGLASFADCAELNKYASFKPMKHLELPQRVNPNIRIRQACAERLMELVEKSQDSLIAQEAKNILRFRTGKEKNYEIRELLKKDYTYTSETDDGLV